MGSSATIDYATLCDELGALIAAPAANDKASRARVERTLTDGYASAMQLEAERLRLERRIGEVAAQVSVRRRGAKTEELAELSLRLSEASGDLHHLRELLVEARRSASKAAQAFTAA
jgi:predicted secreted protein